MQQLCEEEVFVLFLRHKSFNQIKFGELFYNLVDKELNIFHVHTLRTGHLCISSSFIETEFIEDYLYDRVNFYLSNKIYGDWIKLNIFENYKKLNSL